MIFVCWVRLFTCSIILVVLNLPLEALRMFFCWNFFFCWFWVVGLVQIVLLIDLKGWRRLMLEIFLLTWTTLRMVVFGRWRWVLANLTYLFYKLLIRKAIIFSAARAVWRVLHWYLIAWQAHINFWVNLLKLLILLARRNQGLFKRKNRRMIGRLFCHLMSVLCDV